MMSNNTFSRLCSIVLLFGITTLRPPRKRIKNRLYMSWIQYETATMNKFFFFFFTKKNHEQVKYKNINVSWAKTNQQLKSFFKPWISSIPFAIILIFVIVSFDLHVWIKCIWKKYLDAANFFKLCWSGP